MAHKGASNVAKPNDTLVELNQQAKRTGIVAFFKESFREFKRVRWPKRREVVVYTAACLLVCAILGVLIWAFDIGVSAAMSAIGVD